MTIQQSIERLTYTISKGHKPNQSDKLALNKVITDLNNNAAENIKEHILFAKLYAIVLKDFCIYYTDIDFANKQINKELEAPLDYHLELLRLQLNNTEVNNFIKSKGIVDPLFNFEKYKHLFPNISSSEFLSVTETWDKENTNAHFTNSVNQSILCLKNSK